MTYCDAGYDREGSCPICDDTGLGEFVTAILQAAITVVLEDGGCMVGFRDLVTDYSRDSVPYLVHEVCQHLALIHAEQRRPRDQDMVRLSPLSLNDTGSVT